MILALLLLVAPLPQDPALVPWPASTSFEADGVEFTAGRLVATSPDLQLAAAALSLDLPRFVPGFRWALPGEPALAIELELDPNLPDGLDYELEIGDGAQIRGRDVSGVIHGTVTLQQAIEARGGQLFLPRGTVRDRAGAPFRGLMIDVARQRNTILELAHIVDLCRLYKLDVLQLHLSDDQGWTFPSARFPALGTSNWNDIPRYDVDDLRTLVRYADARGVTLVPEINLPGHSAAMRRALPDVFDPANLGNVNVATEPVWSALAALLDEVCDVFASSPYLHIGGDEVGGFERVFEHYKEDPWVRARGIKSSRALFRAFLVHAAELAEARGKRLMAWEGHREVASELERILWVAWENAYFPLPDMLAAGYEVVNAAWCPLYLLENQTDVTPEFLYERWGLTTYGRYRGLPRSIERCDLFDVEPNEALIGGLFSSWENRGSFQLTGLRPLLPAFAERLWNPGALGRRFDDFEARAARVDAAFARATLGAARESEPERHFAPTSARFDEPFSEPLPGRWEIRSENGDYEVVEAGLTWPGLRTSDGALRFQLETDTPNLSLARALDGGAPARGEEIWLAYLLRVDGPVNPGHLYVRLGSQALAVGKRWGATFAIDNTGATTPLESGRTYLVVARNRLSEGEGGRDRVDLWIDPPLGAEPALDIHHDVKWATLSPTGELAIDVQGHSAPRGTWTIDELRVGGTWEAVLPQDPGESHAVPQAVTELTATDGEAGPQLAWVEDPLADGYRVLRAPREAPVAPLRSRARQVAEVEGTTFTDARAVRGLRYRYWVVPFNENGAGPSALVDARAPAAAPARPYDVKGIELLAGSNSPLPRGARIVFYGDSITDVTRYQRFLVDAVTSSAVTRERGVVFLNRGINGGKAEDILLGIRRYGPGGGQPDPLPFPEQLSADDPDVAVIYIGVNEPNDFKPGDYPSGPVEHASPPTSDAGFRATLTTLVQAARDRGARVVLATPSVNGELPPGENALDERLDALAQVVREVAAAESVVLVDLRRTFQAYLAEHVSTRARSGTLTGDGVHPNERGSRLTAEGVADGIARALRD